MKKDLKYKDIIYIQENILSDKECDSLINEYDSRKDRVKEGCTHAVTGLQTESTFKRVELLPKTKNFDLIHNKTEEMINNWIIYLDKFKAFHTHVLKKIMRFSHLYRLMKYEKGEWIHPHVDFDIGIIASCTFALNDDYEGGEFVFFNGNHKVKLKKGSAMIWPADCFWVHEVKPIIKNARYSTNSFIINTPYNFLKTQNKISDTLVKNTFEKEPHFYKSSLLNIKNK